jgi:polysaccharide biosynthesis/export protein
MARHESRAAEYDRLVMVILLMVNICSHICMTRFSYWSTASILLFLAISAGCNSAYRVSRLPAEYLAPAPVNAENINLAGLADTTVSREIIQLGDVLDISMVTDYAKLTTTTTPVRVADDGTIVVPLVGKVAVAGLEVEEAEQLISSESITRGVFRNPCITVTMKECRTNKITVVGAVEEPGTIELPRANSSLLNALVAAGGLRKDADTEIEIRRTDSRNLGANRQQTGGLQAADKKRNDLVLASHNEEQPVAGASLAVTKVNLDTTNRRTEKLPELRDGDVIYVAKRVPKPVYVLGLVRKPGEFPYPVNQELRVLDAIALAGGCSNPLAEDVLVIRRLPEKSEPIRIAVSLQAAKQGQDNVALAPGDTVSVEHTPVTAFADMIQTFVRVGLGASMTLY